MALLQRTRILPNERLDLPDYNRIEDFVCADFKAIHKKVLANENFVLQGFVATGVGTNTLSIVLADSAAIFGGDDGSIFIGAPSLAALATTSLSPGTTNYVEILVDQDTGGADSRAFWDPTAAGGAGAEFSQIVDTFTFLEANLSISTSNFSGDPDKAKICEVDTNGSGVITEIRDRRDMYYRLGRGTDVNHVFPWASRTEPVDTQFTGADKDINTQKQLNDALMDSIREIKGVNYWFEQAPITLGGSFQNTGLSILTAGTTSARFAWSGTQLSITDDNGTPLDGDVLAYIRLFNSASVIGLSRQDLANAISIANDEVLWVELPDPLANVTYDTVGVTSLNYRVTARGSVPLDDDTYWLAYRDGNRLYVRGLGQLEAGEAHQITDETTVALATFLGFDPETATSVPYTAVPGGSLPATFNTSDSLVTAISALAEDVNFLEAFLNNNAYDEPLVVVSGAPADTNEVTGPIVASTVLSLPLDSRDGSSSEVYIVGQGFLEVMLNGVDLIEGIDWEEVGTIGNPSSTFRILIDLEVDDQLHLRIDTAGGIVSTGGGSSTLQDAYNLGSIITTSIGVPFTVGGSASKVAQFNGDIGVTGVIDPKGITFTREATNPILDLDDPNVDGIWFDTSGEMHVYQEGVGDTNVTQVLAAAGAIANTATGIQVQVDNTTIEINTNALRVKANSIGPSHLTTAVADQSTITGGNGSALAVANAPLVSRVMVAGEAFAADVSFLVRMALTGETAGRVYKADKDASASNKYMAIGIAKSVAGVSAGGNIQVTMLGEHDLGANDSAFASGDVGKELFVGTAGAIILGAALADTANEAAFCAGVVQTTTKIWVDFKQLRGIA